MVTGSPSRVDDQQLEELGIEVRTSIRDEWAELEDRRPAGRGRSTGATAVRKDPRMMDRPHGTTARASNSA